jgi:hypothetical protein
MALLIDNDENKVITLVICGCHNGNCCKQSNGCGKKIILKEKYNANRATPITRLFLHSVFGRKYRLNALINKFNEYFDDGKNYNVDGIEYMKKIILEDLETDNGWKICSKCECEYKAKTREFQNIVYIIPTIKFCTEHTQT